MTAARAVDSIQQRQIKSLWGMARELGLEKEDLYGILYRVSKKESMRALTVKEANDVMQELIRLKDPKGESAQKPGRRRTDEGGRESTKPMRRKIYMLCQTLGWNDNEQRIAGFCKKMFGIERVEWLSEKQCFHLIEALKKMAERRGEDADH
ncbi:MAG: regulatory protein GemA [Peptostreptococcaceae bacterium]|nr:regulatory protein GemA [Peptostreptococcaceae bacterium]